MMDNVQKNAITDHYLLDYKVSKSRKPRVRTLAQSSAISKTSGIILDCRMITDPANVILPLISPHLKHWT
jgi:hypothetical protein